MKKTVGAVVVASALVLASAGSLFAQEDTKPVITRVALWDVKRENWSKFVKFFEKYDQPIMETLFAAGVINEWGIDAFGLHHPEGYTHGTWYSAMSYEALQKVDEAYEAAAKSMGEEESDRVEAEFAGMLHKHRDYMLRSIYQRAKAAKLEKAFFSEGYFRLKPGQADAYKSFWDEHVKPVHQKLMDDGVIVAYGMYTEEIVTEPIGMRGSWYVVRDAAGIDKVRAAFQKASASMTEERRRQWWAGIKEFADVDSYRQSMTQMIHFAIAER